MSTARSSTANGSRGHSQRVLSPILRIALLLGVAVHLAGFLVFKISSKRLPGHEPSEPFVQFVSTGESGGDSRFVESAALLDTAPLFVPTKWNAARGDLRLPGLGEQVVFSEFEPEIDLAGELRPAFLEIAQADGVEAPGDLLDLDVARVFGEYARREMQRTAFEAPAPFARFERIRPVTDAALPAAGDAYTLRADLELESEAEAQVPAEFVFRLNGDGSLIGEPVLSDGSGTAAFDAAAKRWLRKAETLARLPPGYFRVRVFP